MDAERRTAAGNPADLSPPHRIRPEAYRRHWVESVVEQRKLFEATDSSAFTFLIGNEAFALPTTAVHEVVRGGEIHSLPHRTNGVLLGLTNYRGELLTCVSLSRFLGVPHSAAADTGDLLDRNHSNRGTGVAGRLAVIQWRGCRIGFPVDQTLQTFRFSMESLAPAPAAVEAGLGCVLGLLKRDERLITFLDADRLITSLSQAIR
jgi:chemotaxis-related protein WspD